MVLYLPMALMAHLSSNSIDMDCTTIASLSSYRAALCLTPLRAESVPMCPAKLFRRVFFDCIRVSLKTAIRRWIPSGMIRLLDS